MRKVNVYVKRGASMLIVCASISCVPQRTYVSEEPAVFLVETQVVETSAEPEPEPFKSNPDRDRLLESLASNRTPLEQMRELIRQYQEKYYYIDPGLADAIPPELLDGFLFATVQMISVPAGWYWRGCASHDKCQDDEKPGKKIYLSAFSIDKHEVTVEAYRGCVAAGRCEANEVHISFEDESSACNYSRGADFPMNCVTWDEADAFCKWAGKRLPSEAEWEAAARGADGRVYVWGNHWPPRAVVANIGDVQGRQYGAEFEIPGYHDGYEKSAPVCSYDSRTLPHRLCDMTGNMWEWTADFYSDSFYGSSPERDPVNRSESASRTGRGGDYTQFSGGNLRVGNRFDIAPHGRWEGLGFRCAR